MLVFRIRENGERYEPAITRRKQYQLADPAFGAEKHHAKNAVYADTLEEAVKLVRQRGFLLWMRGQQTGQRNLISPEQISIVE